jgi:hypothetical protein
VNEGAPYDCAVCMPCARVDRAGTIENTKMRMARAQLRTIINKHFSNGMWPNSTQTLAFRMHP